jgi:AcrR family transcriptional regulator
MPKAADETRRKLLEAATAEFATYGIAGARVERITQSAGVNNALLYRYFGSKLDLFDRVFVDLVAVTLEEVPLDGSDLPGYAGRLFDYYAEHEEVVRLAAWRELERPDSEVPTAISEAHAAKVAQVAQAQADGHASTDFEADELLDLVVLLSLSATPLVARLTPPQDRDRVRKTVVAAARAIASGPSTDRAML